VGAAGSPCARPQARSSRAKSWAPRRAQDDALLLTSSADGTARLWELEKGECIGVLSGHTAGVNAVAMDVAGRLAATCSADGTGRLWDLATCQCLHVLAGHGGSNLGARRDCVLAALVDGVLLAKLAACSALPSSALSGFPALVAPTACSANVERRARRLRVHWAAGAPWRRPQRGRTPRDTGRATRPRRRGVGNRADARRPARGGGERGLHRARLERGGGRLRGGAAGPQRLGGRRGDHGRRRACADRQPRLHRAVRLPTRPISVFYEGVCEMDSACSAVAYSRVSWSTVVH
jgi:hypothetical protein